MKFIRTIDHLFDVLNSRNPKARGFKAALANEDQWKLFSSDAFDYISTITDVSGKPMFATPRITPFLGFLVGIKSVQYMHNKLVSAEQPKLKYILTYKMSQDHLELFFCAMHPRMQQ